MDVNAFKVPTPEHTGYGTKRRYITHTGILPEIDKSTTTDEEIEQYVKSEASSEVVDQPTDEKVKEPVEDPVKEEPAKEPTEETPEESTISTEE